VSLKNEYDEQQKSIHLKQNSVNSAG